MSEPFARSVSRSSNPLRQKHIRLDFASHALRRGVPSQLAAGGARGAHSGHKRPDTLLAVSRLRVALVAVGAALLTGACAAGQVAQTADEKPSLDGTNGSVGTIDVRGVAFHAPSGSSYSGGSSVPLSAYIVNNGTSADRLVKVESPAFSGGWDVVSTPSLLPGPSGAPAPAPASKPVSGRPQKIAPGTAIGLGLQNLSSSGAGSPESLVLLGLGKSFAPLFPGMSAKVTFTFANAGKVTLTVPVELKSTPNTASLPPAPPSSTA
jgi:copper(I)-binding protein